MKSNSIQLVFDLGEYEPRKVGIQSAFEKHPICIDIMRALTDIVEQAHRETRAHLRSRPPMEIGRNDYSNMVNSLTVGRMCDRFPQYVSFRRGRKLLRVDGFQIFFKQLYGRDHLPQHGPSESSFALEMNLQHKYDSSRESVIWMGWHVAPDHSRIIGLFATHQNENKKWHTDVLDLIAAEDQKRFAVEPTKGVNPKLKKNKKKKQNNS